MAGLVDALAHVDDLPAFDAWAQATTAAGVTDVLCAGVDPCTDFSGIDLTKQSSDTLRLHLATGLHPRWVTATNVAAACTKLRERLANPAWIAVGEIGLDGRDDSPPAALQEQAFLAQLQLARAFERPVIIHCVQRVGRLVEILEQEGAPHGALVHGFAGPRDLVPRLVACNVSFSVGGLVLNPQAKRCHAAARAIPADRLLVETDAPEIAPADLMRVLRKLAVLRGEAVQRLVENTAANARRFYRMPTLTKRFS